MPSPSLARTLAIEISLQLIQLDYIALQGRRREQLGRVDEPAREALLAGVAQEDGQAGVVACQSAGPPGGTHQVTGAFGLRVEPGQHVAGRRRLGQPGSGSLPCLLERL